MRVLIIKPSSLGDVVHALPVAAALKRQVPDAHLSWLVSDQFAELVRLSAEVDEVLLFRRREWGRGRQLGSLRQLYRQLRRPGYDLVLDLQGLARSGLCTWLARAPRKVGFAAAREGAALAYRECVTIPAGMTHAVDKNLHLLATALGRPCPYAAPRFRPQPAADAEALRLLAAQHLAEAGPLLAVAPCSRWPSKSWPPEFFIATLQAVLAEAPPATGVWLLGSPDERETAAAIAAPLGPRVANLAGATTFPVMLALLRRTALLLTNDSGPMHLAAALGVPTAALFGPTDPNLTGPYGPAHRVFRSQVPCAPCFQRQCPLPRQICRDDLIAPELVADYITAQLALPPPAAGG
jgi:lipopolysaccharide heptosyltransferase I